MSAKENFLHKLSIALMVSGLMAISAVWVSGQSSFDLKIGHTSEAPTNAYVDDWSHHHMVFSNPGTETDALAKSSYEDWLKISNDPRYKLQQLKRSNPARQPAAPAVAQAASARKIFASRVAAITAPGDFTTRLGIALSKPPSPSPIPRGLPKRSWSPGRPLEKDWSQTLNPLFSTGTITTNNATGSSSVTINGTALNASPPTAGTQSGSVGSLPTTTSTNSITVTNTSPANTFNLTTAATAASGYKANFAGPIVGGTNISFTSGGNTFNISPAGTQAHYTDTVTNTAPSTSSTVTITSGTNALVLTATKGTGGTTATGDLAWNSTSGMAVGDTFKIGNTTYQLETSASSCSSSDRCVDYINSRSTMVTRFVSAIGGSCFNTGGCPASTGGAVNDAAVTAAADGTADVFLYNITTGSVSLSGTSSTSGNWTFNNVTGGSSQTIAQNVTNTCSTSLLGTFIQTPFTASLATYLAAAVNSCNTNFTAVGATASVGGSMVTITDAFPGALTFTVANGATNPIGSSQWAQTAGTNGTPACGGSGGTYTVAFNNASTGPTTASNFSSALNLSGCPAAGGFTSTYTGTNTYATVSNTILGTATFTPATATNFSWTVGTAGTNGSNACTSATSASYATSTTSGGVATNISAAINACSAFTATIGLNNNSSPSGSNVAVNAITPGSTGGSTVTLSPTTGGIFNWNASTLSVGADGTQNGSTWTYWSGSSAVSTGQLATNIASTINSSGLTSEVSAQAVGSTVVVTSLTGTAYAVSDGSFTGFAWSPATTSSGMQSTVQPNMYPALYGQSLTAASCSDFIAFPTGMTGASNAATIVAYENLYTSGASHLCSGPTVTWAYNTGGAATTSPILSLDGTQLAFIQSSGSAASLVLLKWFAGSGTLSAPVTPTPQATAAAYASCTSTAIMTCMYSIPLSGPVNDTRSAPYSDYAYDNIYVGDDNGYLHQFTHVFGGTPGENTTSPWPVHLNSTAGTKISSPVFDDNSGDVLVGDSTGVLYNVESNGATVNNTTSLGDIIADAPLVDGSAGTVFAFVTSSGTGKPYAGNNVVVGYTTTFGNGYGSPGTTYVGTGGAGYYLYAGSFDNLYYNSTTGTGNMFVASNTGAAGGGTLYEVGISNKSMTGLSNALVTGINSTLHPWPSPLTEFCNGTCALNASQTATISGTDFVFFSVAQGAVTGCTNTAGNGCVVSYTVNPSVTSTTYTGTVTTGSASVPITSVSKPPAGTGDAGMLISDSLGCIPMGATVVSVATGGTPVTMSNAAATMGTCTAGAHAGDTVVITPKPTLSGSSLNVTNQASPGCWATSGIVIDNPASSTTGGSQIYFVNLNGQAAGGPVVGGKTSSNCTQTGTATNVINAVQATQAAP